MSRSAWLTGAVFAAALLSRSVWFPAAKFHPDESTVLWMALDAVRSPHLPDHGLISSYHVFQPPGFVWLTMPFVALGGGRPEPVIVGLALLNAAAVALLVATVTRAWGLLYAAALGTFLVVGPDAVVSGWVWHPSLYTGAMALMLAAAIRLRIGSTLWAAVVVLVPGLYALAHYSGLVLFSPALAVLVVSRRAWRELVAPVAGGILVAALAWLPFLVFEAGRDWTDMTAIVDAADDDTNTVAEDVRERLQALHFAISHLGQSIDGVRHLEFAIWPLVLVALVVAVVLRRWRELGFALPGLVLASGLMTQVALGQGEREDVLLMWLVPLYALAAWGLVQIVELVPLVSARRLVATGVAVILIALVAVIGSVDLAKSVRLVPHEQRLDEKWREARAGTPVPYAAALHPALSVNRFYLPCDPPYDWGSEVWYLREVLEPGVGRAAAERAGAFTSRRGARCGED